MRMITVSVAGTPTAGDICMVSYSHKTGGGVSTLKYVVKPAVDEIVTDPTTQAKTVKTVAQTAADIAKGLLDELNKGQSWPNEEFQGSLKDPTTLLIKCKDDHEHAGNTFAVEVQGAKTETLTLEVH